MNGRLRKIGPNGISLAQNAEKYRLKPSHPNFKKVLNNPKAVIHQNLNMSEIPEQDSIRSSHRPMPVKKKHFFFKP